jgi:hypothetical protein
LVFLNSVISVSQFGANKPQSIFVRPRTSLCYGYIVWRRYSIFRVTASNKWGVRDGYACPIMEEPSWERLALSWKVESLERICHEIARNFDVEY